MCQAVHYEFHIFSKNDCGCSVTKSCLTLCYPTNYSMSGFPGLHCLPEFAQIYVH